MSSNIKIQKWNKEEEMQLLKDFNNLAKKDLVKKYNRSFNAIRKKYNSLIQNLQISHFELDEVLDILEKGFDEKNNRYLIKSIQGDFYVFEYFNNKLEQVKFKTEKDFTSYFLRTYCRDLKDGDIKEVRKAISLMPFYKIVFNPYEYDYSIINKKIGIREFNVFTKTKYMQIADFLKERHNHLNEKDFKERFPRVYAHLTNLTEGSYTYLKFYLDLLAAKVQERDKYPVIFVFKGLQGSGKNLNDSLYLKNLVGEEKFKLTNIQNMSNRFNSFLSNAFFCAIDESSLDIKETNLITEKVKTLSGNKVLQVEKKGKDIEDIQTYFNFLIYSNSATPVKLDLDDRRFYVFNTNRKLEDIAREKFNESIQDFIKNLKEEELEDFLIYIATLNYNKDVLLDAKLLNNTKIALALSTNKRAEIFYKILIKKDKKYLKWLYKELIKINAENEEYNHKLEENNHYRILEKKIVLSKVLIEDFFIQLLAGKVKRKLLKDITDLFINSYYKEEKNIDRILLEKFGEPKRDRNLGYVYVVGEPANFNDFTEIFEEEEFNDIYHKNEADIYEVEDIIFKAKMILVEEEAHNERFENI